MATRLRRDRDPAETDNLAIEDFLTYRLLTLTNRLNRQAMSILEKEAALRLPEWRCLAFIERFGNGHGKVSFHKIAEVTGMDRALISRGVQGLLEKGLVLTERDRTDRRVWHASLTRKGRSLFERMLPMMRKRQLHLLGALSPSDRKAVYRIIDRLNDALVDWDEEQKKTRN